MITEQVNTTILLMTILKKRLSDRMYKLQDGTEVQRDWYSSFLLYCYDYRTKDIDKNKCISEFDKCYKERKGLNRMD